MAVQFPNFLNAQLLNPDYSGISDAFTNYYAGRAMPKDDLIKQIQAQFARPNAEETLKAIRLGNQKNVLDIQRLRQDAQQTAQINALLASVLGGGGNQMPQGGASPAPQSPMPQSSAMRPMTMQNNPSDLLRNINPALAGVLQQPQQPQQQTQAEQQQPSMPLPPAAPAGGVPLSQLTANMGISGNNPRQAVDPRSLQLQPNEVVLKQGSPRLAALNKLYEENPLVRATLENKGFKKEQKVAYENKTGQTRITTTYPDGMVTQQITKPEADPNDKDGDIPLTKKVLNSAVAQVRGIDAVMPYIDKLTSMGEKGELPISHSGWWNPLSFTNAQADYHGVVSEALDKYMNATGLNITDKSLDTVRDILERHGGESTKNYIKRLRDAKAGKIRDRATNVQMINKGLKRFPNFGSESSGDATFSSEEYEAV